MTTTTASQPSLFDTPVPLTLRELRDRLAVGTTWNLTNHMIPERTRPAATVLSTNTVGFVLDDTTRGPDGHSNVDWPKARNLTATADGALHFELDGRPGPFLTLRPVA